VKYADYFVLHATVLWAFSETMLYFFVKLRLTSTVNRGTRASRWPGEMSWLTKLASIPNRPIIWLATFLHMIVGIFLILDSRVAFVTGLRWPAEAQPDVVGLTILGTGLLGLWALIRDAERGPSLVTFWCLIPQQVVLFVIAAGAIYAVGQGHYASGTVLPRSFIFVDQLPKLLLAMLHPFGVLRMHVPILPVDGFKRGGRGGRGGEGGAGGRGAGGEPGEPGMPGEPGEEGSYGT
jgi:hypothetical protein